MKKLLQSYYPVLWGYKPKGMCPVQSEGYFMGYYFYFSARFDKISIDFANSNQDWWDGKIVFYTILKDTYGMYDAGYYPLNKCTNLIYKGFFLFMIYKIFKIKL